MPASRPPALHRIATWALLGAVGLWILAIFLRPSLHHVGINEYDRSLFIPMVEGTAHEPFVHRTLLPLLTRGLSALVPGEAREALAAAIERGRNSRRAFEKLRWETSEAHRYLVAALLMWLSYVGFAHYVARLSVLTCGLRDTPRMRATLGVLALLGLPPFFRYTSFPYDPPQLFLFAAALFFLASRQTARFCGVFVLCCLNKETAVLLIPVCALTCRGALPGRRYAAVLAGLVAGYAAVELSLLAAFRWNPGSPVEWHLLDHNVHWLTESWTMADLVAWSVAAALLFYGWKEKPRFLKVSFVCSLPPLVVFAFFLGYVDEWRGYYEAYPAAVGLAADTFRRLLTKLGER